MAITFHGLPTAAVTRIRQTMKDSYGEPVEAHISDGEGVPCRHCLEMITTGAAYLILAHRPFLTANPYAETGPIFLCKDDCPAHEPGPELPAILQSPGYIVRGYSADERICYGTGKVTPTPDIPAYAAHLLDRPNIAFVDIRSAANNCYQCRVTRA